MSSSSSSAVANSNVDWQSLVGYASFDAAETPSSVPLTSTQQLPSSSIGSYCRQLFRCSFVSFAFDCLSILVRFSANQLRVDSSVASIQIDIHVAIHDIDDDDERAGGGAVCAVVPLAARLFACVMRLFVCLLWLFTGFCCLPKKRKQKTQCNATSSPAAARSRAIVAVA
jgi:hypothetical protein